MNYAHLIPIVAVGLLASSLTGCTTSLDPIKDEASKQYDADVASVTKQCSDMTIDECDAFIRGLTMDYDSEAGAFVVKSLYREHILINPLRARADAQKAEKAKEVAQAGQGPKHQFRLEQTASASQVSKTIPSLTSTEPLSLWVASSDGRPVGKAWEALSPQQRYQWVLKDYAYRHGVPFAIAHSQINQESGFRANVCSNAGACGIAQFIATTAKRFKVKRDDPHSSLDGAMRYMAELRKSYGRWEVALAAYNGGADGARFAQAGFSPEYGRQLHAKRKAQGSYFDWKQNKHYVSSIMSKARRMGYGG